MSDPSLRGWQLPPSRHCSRGVNAVRILAVAWPSAWLGYCGVVRAAETTSISISITACEEAEIAQDRLLELLRTEVAPAALVVAGSTSPSVIQGTIELCHGSPEFAWIVLRDESRRTLERTVNLSDVAGELRLRTLAVTFGEMVLILKTTAEQPLPANPRLGSILDARAPPGEEQRSSPIRAAPDRRSATQTDSRSNAAAGAASPRIGAGVMLREFARPATTLTGPWLSFGSDLWQAEALFLATSNQVPTGTVSLYNLNAAASFIPLQFGTNPRVQLGLRGEIGIAFATGAPSANSQALGTTQRQEQAVLLAEPRFEVHLSSAFSLQARIAIGIASGPTATANHVSVATCGGAFVGTALGVNVGL